MTTPMPPARGRGKRPAAGTLRPSVRLYPAAIAALDALASAAQRHRDAEIRMALRAYLAGPAPRPDHEAVDMGGARIRVRLREQDVARLEAVAAPLDREAVIAAAVEAWTKKDVEST